MGLPKNSKALPRHDLSIVANEYALEASQRGFVGQEIMPIHKSSTKSGTYKKIKPDQVLKRVETDRAPSGTFHRSTQEYELADYNCRERGHEEPIDDGEAAANIGFDDEAAATRRGIDIILRGHEERVISKVKSLSDNDVDTAWTSSSNATPKADVKAGILKVRNRIGVDPDLIVMSQGSFDAIIETSDFMERTKYVNNVEGVPEAQRMSLVANYLGVSRLLIAKAIVNGADEGQSFTASPLWQDSFALLIPQARGSLAEPGQFGRTVIWTFLGDNLASTDNYYEEQTTSQIYRTRSYTDEVVVNEVAAIKLTKLSA